MLAGLLAAAGPTAADPARDTAVRLETELNARVGVLLRAPGGDVAAEHRADERFPLNSTFKALLCGAVLARIDAGKERLDATVGIARDDLVSHSPVAERRVGARMTVGELCHATLTQSDNAAANLLMVRVGGPEALTAFLRVIGDDATRVDRYEPAKNEGRPGDPRDTTTPAAILSALEALLLGDALTPALRARLHKWMVGNAVSDTLIRSVLPEGWTIADRGGAGGYGSRSIVALITRPDGASMLAAIYITDTTADFATRDAAVAEIAKVMVGIIEASERD